MEGATSNGDCEWTACLLFMDGKMSAPSDCGRVPQLQMLARWRRELFIDDSYTGTEAMVSKKRENRFADFMSFMATEDDELSSVNTTSRQQIFRQLVMVASDDPLARDLDWSFQIPNDTEWALMKKYDPDVCKQLAGRESIGAAQANIDPLDLFIGFLADALHGNTRLESLSLAFQSETGRRFATLSDEVYEQFLRAVRHSNLTKIHLPHPSWFVPESNVVVQNRGGDNYTAPAIAQAASRLTTVSLVGIFNAAFKTWMDQNRCYQRLLIAAMSQGMMKSMPALLGDLVGAVCTHLKASRLCPGRAEWELNGTHHEDWTMPVSDAFFFARNLEDEIMLYNSGTFMWHCKLIQDETMTQKEQAAEKKNNNNNKKRRKK